MKKRTLVKAGAILLTMIIVAACFASCGKSADMGAYADDMPNNEMEIGNAGSTLPPKGDQVGKDDSLADKEESGEDGESFAPKIIRKVTMSAETRDFKIAVTEIEGSVAKLGGYVESCNVRNMQNSYRGDTVTERYADYVIRIPAESLDAFLSETGALLNVTSTSSSAEDISGEYYDIQARLSVLETERKLLEDMLAEADSVNTMLTLEQRLYDVIYEIESYKTAIKVYDSKVAYSTVNLSLREVVELTETDENKTFWDKVGDAAVESWEITLTVGEEIIINSIYLAPLIIAFLVVTAVVAAIVIIVIVVIRKRAKRSKASK